MKFPYPELSTVTHADKRWYDTPAGFYPSITTVLGTTAPEEAKQALKRWQDSLGTVKAAQKSKEAQDRGTNVHLLCERFLRGEDLRENEFSQADVQSFRALKTKLNQVDEVWGLEVALYSKDLELAGRCDLIGVYRGVPSIIDFKTSGRVKQHKDIIDYKLQVAFYGNAHDEMFGTDIKQGIILMVAETGFPMEFKVDLAEHMPALRERAQRFWQDAINSV